MEWADLKPNKAGDWINQRTERFSALRPLAAIESQPPGEAPIFEVSTLGLISNRDAWVFQSSAEALLEQIERTAAFFNEQVRGFMPPAGPFSERLAAARAYARRDDTLFRWAVSSEERLTRRQEIHVAYEGYRLAVYRPFFRQHLYMDRALNHRVHRLPGIFAAGVERMPGIVLANKVTGDAVGVLAVDTVPSLDLPGRNSRFFPRYLAAEANPAPPGQGALLVDEPNRNRLDNINPDAVATYRARLGEEVTADQVFAYVYGVLHSPEYRERYAADLARLLPRIPDPADRGTFDAFAEAGQQLLDLHIGYEDAEPYPLEERITDGAPHHARYLVEKMRWGGTRKEPDRSRIVYNDWITLAGIPDEAHDYVVGPRSALAWLIDRYQVKTDKASGIVNDVNAWGLERGEPRYILDLVKRIVTVSVETMRIVRGLPELREAE